MTKATLTKRSTAHAAVYAAADRERPLHSRLRPIGRQTAEIRDSAAVIEEEDEKEEEDDQQRLVTGIF